MRLRLSSVTRNGKTYQYAQLVESVAASTTACPSTASSPTSAASEGPKRVGSRPSVTMTLAFQASTSPEHFAPLYGVPANQSAFELEFKLTSPDRALVIKQVRPYVVR